MLISPNGMRSLFIADRLPTLREVNIAFAHVWQELGHEQGAEGFQPAFRRISSQEPYHPRQTLKRLPRKGDAKGFR
jgi:hypothetical protein